MLAIGLVGLLGVLLLGTVALSVGEFGGQDRQLVLYTVTRGDLPITVVERGNLDSQEKVEVYCGIENLSYDRSGSSGTQILYIIPNGQSVKKGDLLVEFDAAALQDRLDSQVLALERARAEKLQADAQYENRITQNETALAEAKLQVELKKLDLKSFEDEDGGEFQLDLQAVEMDIQVAQADKLIKETDKDGVDQLYKLGYKSKGDLAQARLSAMSADRQLANAISKRKKTIEYDYKKQRLVLEGALATAERNKIQVGRDNESELAQAEAAKNAATRSLEKEQEKFDKYTEQLTKCKIYAPQAGMVAYAMPEQYGRFGGSSSQLIAEGAFVRERQKILTLPSLTKMEVKTSVHESVLDQVKVGLKATIRLDAFVDRTYRGTVKSVAVMPDQGGWLSSDTKVYSTVVSIDQEVQGLKPGMTAVVEVDVERLKDVLSVPVQAIVQVGGKSWCYVGAAAGGTERHDLKLGKTNDKFVEIANGLQQGDRVVLNPMAIVDESQKEKEKKEEGKGSSEEAAKEGSQAGEKPAPAKAPDAQAAPGKQPAAGQAKPKGPGGPAEGAAGKPDGQQRKPFNLADFDKNGDGKLSADEAPERMKQFFDRMDANGDGFLDAQEMAAMRRKKPSGGGFGGGRRGPGGGGFEGGAPGPGSGGSEGGAPGPGGGGFGGGRRGLEGAAGAPDGGAPEGGPREPGGGGFRTRGGGPGRGGPAGRPPDAPGGGQ
jgi:RND family efflux transporter MFP subunit